MFLILKLGLLEGDLAVLEHWGMTADGRIVCLDYGLTQDIYKQMFG